MTTVFILVMLLVAFVASRMFRSTKMWWAFILTISVGLLMGMLSNNVVKSQKDFTTYTQSISTGDNIESADMQSLVSTVTEGTTIANLGLQVIDTESVSTLSDALVDQHPLKGRDSPDINDTS